MEKNKQYEYPIELWTLIKLFLLIPKVDKTKINPHAICMKSILVEIEMMNFEQEVDDQELLNEILDNNVNDENIINMITNENVLENEDYLNVYNSFYCENRDLWKKLILFEDNTDREIKQFGLYSSLLMISNKLDNNYDNLMPFVKFKFRTYFNYLDNYSSIYKDLLCNKSASYLNSLEYLYKLQRLNFVGGQLYAYEILNMKVHNSNVYYDLVTN